MLIVLRESATKRRGIAKPNRSLSEEEVCNIFKLQNEGKGLKEIQCITKFSKTKLNNILYHSNRYTDIKLKYNLALIKQKSGKRKKK